MHAQTLSGQTPLLVGLLALCRLLTTLFPQSLPLFILELARTPAATQLGLRRHCALRFFTTLLLPGRLPSNIFQFAGLAKATPFNA
jgi:hypothetical protein